MCVTGCDEAGERASLEDLSLIDDDFIDFLADPKQIRADLGKDLISTQLPENTVIAKDFRNPVFPVKDKALRQSTRPDVCKYCQQ